VSTAVRAEFLDLEAVGIIATILAGDVVTVLADLACERDLRANVGGGHVSCLFLLQALRNGLVTDRHELSGRWPPKSDLE